MALNVTISKVEMICDSTDFNNANQAKHKIKISLPYIVKTLVIKTLANLAIDD